MNFNPVQIHHADYLEDLPFWLSITEGKIPVLEVGSGHGRVTIPLASSGREITGIDNDPRAIDYLSNVLKQHPDQVRANTQLVSGDVHAYQPDRSYGAVVIPCNTYSTFFSPQRIELLIKIKSWLKSAGLFAASVPNPVRLVQVQKELLDDEDVDQEIETTMSHPVTGYPVQVSSRFRALKDRVGWDWIYDHLLPDGQVERYIQTAEHDLASPEDYRTELIEAGFSGVELMGDFQGADYTADSPYLILIGRI